MYPDVTMAAFPDSTPYSPPHTRIEGSIGRRVVGQSSVVHSLLVALFAGGHVLLEGVPGLAKSLIARTLAESMEGSFRRIQFTPDLLPSDILGSMIFQKTTETFVPALGPIFSNVILADEINRAPPKVQSALLEAMEEGQVSLGDTTFPIQKPFLVLATQNPLEHHGTYPLAEAQVDRFMIHLQLDYPNRKDEKEILRRASQIARHTEPPVVSREELLQARDAVDQVHVDDRIQDYVVDIIGATRTPELAGLSDLQGLISAGASPRAGIHLQNAAKAEAYLNDRGFVLPEDVKALAPDVLRHRLLLTVEAHALGVGPDEVLHQILSFVSVP